MLSHLKATRLALWLPSNNERSKTTSRNNDGEQTRTGRTDVMSATQRTRHGLPLQG
jgi:hypothetical protein